MTLAVGVVDLGDHRPDGARAVVAPEHRQGIEHVPERSGTGEQRDPTTIEVDAVPRQVVVDVLAQRRVLVTQVIRGPETRQPPQTARELRDLVDVDQPHRVAVPERVVHPFGAPVRDLDPVHRGSGSPAHPEGLRRPHARRAPVLVEAPALPRARERDRAVVETQAAWPARAPTPRCTPGGGRSCARSRDRRAPARRR